MLDLINSLIQFIVLFQLKIGTMSEARDRLSRPEDVTSMFVRRRQSIRSMGILSDEPEVGLETPFRWGTMAMTGPHQQVGVAAAATRGGSFGTPRNAMGRGRTWFRSPAIGLLNTPIGSSQRGRGRGRGRGRSTNSVLPSWYPRTPLRDITAVVRVLNSCHFPDLGLCVVLMALKIGEIDSVISHSLFVLNFSSVNLYDIDEKIR